MQEPAPHRLHHGSAETLKHTPQVADLSDDEAAAEAIEETPAEMNGCGRVLPGLVAAVVVDHEHSMQHCFRVSQRHSPGDLFDRRPSHDGEGTLRPQQQMRRAVRLSQSEHSCGGAVMQQSGPGLGQAVTGGRPLSTEGLTQWKRPLGAHGPVSEPVPATR